MFQLEEFDVITTGHLHHIMPHVPQKFIRVGADDKLSKYMYDHNSESISEIINAKSDILLCSVLLSWSTLFAMIPLWEALV